MKARSERRGDVHIAGIPRNAFDTHGGTTAILQRRHDGADRRRRREHDARAFLPDPHLGQGRSVDHEAGSLDRDPATFDGRTRPDRGDMGLGGHSLKL